MLAKKGKTQEGDYRGLHWESPEELAFLQWAFELVDSGHIEKVERGRTYTLTDGLYNYYIEQLKTKSKSKQETLLKPSVYTPDYELYWADKGKNLFCNEVQDGLKHDKLFLNDLKNKGITTVEVKPDYNLVNNMERVFNNNKKFLYYRHFVFVNLVKPKQLFSSTFYPMAYLKTPTGKDKVIKGEVKNIAEFLENKFGIIE